MEAAAAGGGRRSLTLPLSTEHNPTIYEERRRIQRAGGTVRYAGGGQGYIVYHHLLGR